jgi:hypothetical protein
VFTEQVLATQKTDNVTDIKTETAQPAPVVLTPAMVTEGFMAAQRASTKASLDAQPKKQIRLPAARKNDPQYEVVGINGYNYQIKRGVEVMVPQAVYDLLVEAQLI